MAHFLKCGFVFKAAVLSLVLDCKVNRTYSNHTLSVYVYVDDNYLSLECPAFTGLSVMGQINAISCNNRNVASSKIILITITCVFTNTSDI